jgi:DNA mismatch endonuclease (patch repair protein)
MAAVRPVHTAPEMVIRKLLTAMKVRYRLHGYRLPGRPDIVIPRLRKVIFVHGCFWHRHARCPKATTPVRNAALWRAKFRATVSRDRRNAARLAKEGWKHLVVWECQLRPLEALQATLATFLAED